MSKIIISLMCCILFAHSSWAQDFRHYKGGKFIEGGLTDTGDLYIKEMGTVELSHGVILEGTYTTHNRDETYEARTVKNNWCKDTVILEILDSETGRRVPRLPDVTVAPIGHYLGKYCPRAQTIKYLRSSGKSRKIAINTLKLKTLLSSAEKQKHSADIRDILLKRINHIEGHDSLFGSMCSPSARNQYRCPSERTISLGISKGEVILFRKYGLNDQEIYELRSSSQPIIDEYYKSGKPFQLLMQYAKNESAIKVVDVGVAKSNASLEKTFQERFDAKKTFFRPLNYKPERYQLTSEEARQLESIAISRVEIALNIHNSTQYQAGLAKQRNKIDEALMRREAPTDKGFVTYLEHQQAGNVNQALLNASKKSGDEFSNLPRGWAARMRLIMDRSFDDLIEIREMEAKTQSNLFTMMGLSDLILPGMTDVVSSQLEKDRYDGFIAQYGIIRNDIYGLCGSPSRKFQVSSVWVTTKKNGLGNIISQTESNPKYFTLTVPSEFGNAMDRSQTTNVGWTSDFYLKNFIRSLGGCNSDRRVQFERNLLDFFNY